MSSWTHDLNMFFWAAELKTNLSKRIRLISLFFCFFFKPSEVANCHISMTGIGLCFFFAFNKNCYDIFDKRACMTFSYDIWSCTPTKTTQLVVLTEARECRVTCKVLPKFQPVSGRLRSESLLGTSQWKKWNLNKMPKNYFYYWCIDAHTDTCRVYYKTCKKKVN